MQAMLELVDEQSAQPLPEPVRVKLQLLISPHNKVGPIDPYGDLFHSRVMQKLQKEFSCPY